MRWNFDSKILALIVSLSVAGWPAPVQGLETDHAHTALVRVDGMVCYFCSSGIEKMCKLKKLGKGYSTDLKKGLFKVKIGEEQRIPPPSTFARIVKDSGFTYRGVQIVLEGKLIGKPTQHLYGLWIPEKHQMLQMEPSTAVVGKLAASNINRFVRVTLDAKKTDPTEWQITGLRAWSAGQTANASLKRS